MKKMNRTLSGGIAAGVLLSLSAVLVGPVTSIAGDGEPVVIVVPTEDNYPPKKA